MKNCLRLLWGLTLFFYSSIMLSQYDYSDNVSPSQNPPGGLSPSDVPQFVTIGWDDNARSGDADANGDALRWIINFMKNKTNPDGTPARFNFYSNSTYFSNGAVDGPNLVKRIHNEAYLDGHEIGNHTHSHPHGSSYSVAQWEAEITECTSWMIKPVPDASAQAWETNVSEGAGVLANDVLGFRTPFLEYNNEVFEALRNQGFVYDCSIEEGYEYDQDGTNFYWPYTLNNGSPGHEVLEEWGTKNFSVSSHPGLWEIPNYVYIVPPDDKCTQYGIPVGLRGRCKTAQSWFDEAGGKITGFDYNLWYQFNMTAAEVLATLKYTFDLRYVNNRAPMMIGAHTQYYHSSWASNFKNATLAEAKKCFEDFIDYVLSKPDAKIVTGMEIINWMREAEGGNKRPVAKISTSLSSGNAPLNVQFSAEGSNDPDGDPITYHWDFDDGTTATGLEVSHVFTEARTYIVTLSVRDDKDAAGTTTTTVVALDVNPGTVKKPFPQSMDWVGCIKPALSQTELNNDVASFYETWKSNFLKPTNTPGGYYVYGDCTGCTVPSKGTSEGHGYGMLITALMAGYDDNAKTYFDGLYQYFDTHRSTTNNELMCWNVAQDERPPWTGSAADGDMDIAYALLLAHYQWGSDGDVNYLQEAKDMITYGLKVSDMSTATKRVMLGDWDTDPYSTRSSDWMTGHMRAYYAATNDVFWNEAADEVYSIMNTIVANYSPNTALMPDFVVGQNPQPAPENFLEAETDNDYSWNACRYPWRIAMDYAHFGTIDAKTNLDKYVNWAKGITNSQPANFKAGYTLDGTALVDYSSNAFISPLMVASIVDPQHQVFLNTGWQQIKDSYYSYYDATINLLSMLIISGNWWVPVDDLGENQAPVAQISADFEVGEAPLAVNFSAEGSIDPDGDPITYNWDFGDGSSDVGITASHIYPTAGIYSATVTVSDDKNKTDSKSITITVESGQNQIAYPEGVPHAIPGIIQAEDYDLGGNLAYLDNDATNNGNAYRNDGVDIEPCTLGSNNFNVGWIETGEWLEYTVNVTSTGNYKVKISTAAIATAGGSMHIESNGRDVTGLITIPPTTGWQDWAEIVTNAQLTAGEQILRIFFDQGGFNLNQMEFSIEDGNIPPIARIAANPTSGIIPLNVQFDASQSSDDKSIISYDWDFGDGSSSTGISVNHLFENAGVYIVTLTVTDNEGATDAEEITINVTEEAGELLVKYKQGGWGGPTDSQINPNFMIFNNGSTDVELSTLSLRYWFTKEGNAEMQYYCDWAELGCSYMEAAFGEENGTNYLELTFTEDAGAILAGSNSGVILSRMSKSDWSAFDENNDYSYDASFTDFGNHNKVTLYQNGMLVWGIEPSTILKNDFVQKTNISYNEKTDIILFPNPAKSNLCIKSSGSLNNSLITIRDLSGKAIYQKKYDKDGDKINIDISVFESGVYLLQLSNPKSIQNYRFVID